MSTNTSDPYAGANTNFIKGVWIRKDDDLLIRRITIDIATVSAFVLCSLLVVSLLWSRHSKKYSAEDLSLGLGHPRISYEELCSATDGFGERNLLAIGTFGSVYKGILTVGTMVDVKVLNMYNVAAEKSFTTECEVLGKVRHQNLVKIIMSCLNVQFKALVLQFMSNGSLEKLLHPDGANEDVVHCDLKPSNVLLDEDMTAHVSNFGIAKITYVDSINSMISMLACTQRINWLHCSMAFLDRLVEVVDNSLLKDSSDDGTEEVVIYKCLEQSIGVGLVCTRESLEEGPNMREVVNMLESIRKTFVGSARPSI
eukprot:Gb_04558 [translate_table: standard]